MQPVLLDCPTGPLLIRGTPAGSGPLLLLSVVIPTLNERENILELIRQLTTLLDRELGDSYELIVVDDDSPDRTWEWALEIAAIFPRLRVVRRQGERGLSSAVIRGWQVARGEILAVIDADLQHPPEVTVRLWEAMKRGVDLAIASRHVDGGGVSDWSLARRVLSRGAQLLGLVILPGVFGRVSDPMSGCFMVLRSAIAGITLQPLGYKILIEVIGRGRIQSIEETGYVFLERSEGKSKVSWRVYIEYLQHLLRLRRAIPWTVAQSGPLFRREPWARFAVVGASGVLVDMAVLFLLSDPQALGLGLTRSKLVAAELAIINNFLWNDAWTFRNLVGAQRGLRHRFRRFAKFNAICGIGLVLSVVLLNLQFNLLHMNRYVANLVAIAVVAAWNIWLNVMLGWRDTGINRSILAGAVYSEPLLRQGQMANVTPRPSKDI
ncbi:MAG TPA: glycosyltransferase [Candidatus Binatia bacterium]|nr:glycosyltransferase [Candidatus Binatia bacterium]